MLIEKSQPNELMDFISFEIFQKIFQSVFNNFDGDPIWDVDLEKFNREQAVLLFSWPLIIAKRYLYPYQELDLFKKQCSVYQILTNDFNLDDIWNSLSDFSVENNIFEKSKKFEKIISENEETYKNFTTFSKLCSNIFEKYEDKFDFKKILQKIDKEPKHKLIDLALGGKPNSKNDSGFLISKITKRSFFANLIDRIINCETTGLKLRNGIFYYYLILLIFLNDFEDKSDETIIDFDDILVSIIEYSQLFNEKADILLSNCLELLSTFGSSLFSDTIKYFLDDYKEIFLKNGFPKNSNFEEHQFYKNNPHYIASILTINDDIEETDKNIAIDVEREIKVLNGLDYKLEFLFHRDLSSNDFLGLISFKCDEKKDRLKQLLHCLSVIAYRLSIHIHDYSHKYSDFISNADIFVDRDLEGFLENIDKIQNSYFLFNEYLDHKDFSRAIENLDMELVHKCIEETRADLKKKKKTHLSPELIKDLLAANNEINILFSTIQRKHDAHKSKIAKDFFKENPHYFKIIKFEDIKDVEFSSDPNGIRNTRRKIFSSIVKRAGKEIAGYKIAKELAVE